MLIRLSAVARSASLAALLLGCAAEESVAQPMPIARRTLGLLAADTQLDAIILMRDLDGNGSASDPGETTVFFDASNLSGLPGPTGNVFVIAQTISGSIFFADGDTDTVYHLRDLNADGDAQDPGEASVWYASTPAFPMPTPNGIAFDSSGAIYIVNAGVAAQGIPSVVFRSVDLDGDGAAITPGEVSVWLDASALIPSTSPFEIGFVGDTAFIADLRGAQPDAIFRATDTDNSYTISAGELNIFIDDTNPFGVPCSFTAVSDGVSIYTHESTSTVNPQRIFRLTDLDGNGVVDAGEAREIWNEGLVPAGFALANSFSIAVGPGSFAIASNGTDAQDNVFLMRDLDSSGDFLQAGETTVFQRGNGTAFAENVRALCFIAPFCPGDWNGDGALNSQDYFDFLQRFFAFNADFNRDGITNSQDYFDFLRAFFEGCP